MANYTTLKAAIRDVVKTNGNNEITGALLQQSLVAMINSLGADYQFVGVAVSSTNPGTPDQNVAYIAGPGTYPNFDGHFVDKGFVSVFTYNGTWNYQDVDICKELYSAFLGLQTTLVQGYATAATSLNSIQLGTQTNRVRTYIIQGNYTVKTNPGYVIRAVSVWRNGPTSGNPSASFSVGSGNAANLVSGVALTEYTKNDDWPCSMITFCKTDATADITPDEDVIAEFGLKQQLELFEESLNSALDDIQNISSILNTVSLQTTIVQGYCSATPFNAPTYIQVQTLATRVRSFIIPGNYTIKTNPGYVIRGIAAWRGGTTSGNPTSGFSVGAGNAVNLVQSGALTEYTKNDDWPCSIITFCKTDDTANITPDEDIIAEFVGPVGLIQRVSDLEDKFDSLPQNALGKVLFMGDSIHYGLASYFNGDLSGVVVDTSNRISDYFARYTGAIQVDNIAARGTGYVADPRNLGNGWVKAQNTDFSNYDMVVICLGVNDYIQHVNIGTIEDNTIGTFIGNMIHVYQKILSDNPLCKIVVCSPYNTWGQWCNDPGSEYQSSILYGDESTDYALGYQISGHTLTDYINAIESVCQHFHIQHVKLSESGMINNLNIKKVLADGLHPIVAIRPMLAQELIGRKMFL